MRRTRLAPLEGPALGTFGAVGCFSFFSNKNLPVGEGGMVVTPTTRRGSAATAPLAWDDDPHVAAASGARERYDVVEPGLNYRLDELRATLAIVQLGGSPTRTRQARSMCFGIGSCSTA